MKSGHPWRLDNDRDASRVRSPGCVLSMPGAAISFPNRVWEPTKYVDGVTYWASREPDLMDDQRRRELAVTLGDEP